MTCAPCGDIGVELYARAYRLNPQGRGFLNSCPHVMHFMFTLAPGPACVNGWVFSDPQSGHGGRGAT
jgi:hypothetical protein